MLAWDRWVAKSSAARTTAIQAETKKARLCFVRFLARNASISRRDRQYTFLWPHNTSDGDHDIQAIAAANQDHRDLWECWSHRGVDYRNFTGFRYCPLPLLPPSSHPLAFSSSIYHFFLHLFMSWTNWINFTGLMSLAITPNPLIWRYGTHFRQLRMICIYASETEKVWRSLNTKIAIYRWTFYFNLDSHVPNNAEAVSLFIS